MTIVVTFTLYITIVTLLIGPSISQSFTTFTVAVAFAAAEATVRTG